MLKICYLMQNYLLRNSRVEIGASFFAIKGKTLFRSTIGCLAYVPP